MTTQKNAKIEDPKAQQSANVPAVQQQGPAGVPAGLMDEMAGYEGAGVSSRADDNIVPFMALFQDMSPEVKKRDPKYVEGAEPGHIMNKASRQLWKPEDELLVQPVHFSRAVVEWVPRDNGGGFVARTDFRDGVLVEQLMKELGGRQVPDARDKSGRKMIWQNSRDNDLIDTRYHVVNVLHPDGRTEPVVMGFSSTGHTSSRAWMTAMGQHKLKRQDGSYVQPPSWFRQYRVRAVEKSNPSGTWFVLAFDDRGWIEDPGVRQLGRALFDSVNSGAVQMSNDEAGGTGDGGGAPLEGDII